MLAQKVCMRLVVKFLCRLLTPLLNIFLLYFPPQLFSEMLFFTYKSQLVEDRSVANGVRKIPAM